MAITKIGTTGISNNLDVPGYLYLSGDNKELRFYNGANYMILKASGSLSNNYTITLPVDDGTASQVLTTDGGGVLSWSTPSAGATLSGSTNNTIVTVTDSNAMIGEANLTFTGTSLINTSANDAGDNVISVINTSNTANDGAYVDIQSGGNAAGDAYVHFDANSEWSVGVDRDQGRFAISYNASGAKPGNSDILTIEQTGKISFQVSNQEFAMSGNSITELAGVNFLASQSASANANTLDDYEEGTFTPILDAAWPHTSSGMTHSTQFGHYTKVGNRVNINLRVVTTATGDVSGGSTAMAIRGLPFVCDNTANSETGLIVGYSAGLSMTAGHAFTGVTDANGLAKAHLRQNSDGEGFKSNVTRDNITTTCTINMSGTYEVDS